MDSVTSASFAKSSSLKSLSLLLLGMLLGAGLVALWLGYHSSHGGGAAGMAGAWTGTVEVAGTQVAVSLTVQKTGETFSGELVGTPGGQARFQDATIDAGGNISFSINVAGEAVSFTGKAAPDRRSMAGTLATTTHGNGTWSFTKQS